MVIFITFIRFSAFQVEPGFGFGLCFNGGDGHNAAMVMNKKLQAGRTCFCFIPVESYAWQCWSWNLNYFDEIWYKLPVRELKKSLKEGLPEGGGQVELLAAVVNLSTFCLQWNIIGAASQANVAGLLQPANRAESFQSRGLPRKYDSRRKPIGLECFF